MGRLSATKGVHSYCYRAVANDAAVLAVVASERKDACDAEKHDFGSD